VLSWAHYESDGFIVQRRIFVGRGKAMSDKLELVRWDRIDKEIAVTDDMLKLKQMSNQMKAIQQIAKLGEESHHRTELGNKAFFYRYKIDKKRGEWISKNIEKGRPKKNVDGDDIFLDDINTSRDESVYCQKIMQIDEKVALKFIEHCNATLKDATKVGLKQFLPPLGVPIMDASPLLKGKYAVLVIDPPWDIKKIPLEVRPNQDQIDYPVMTLEEITEWSLAVEKAAKDCHVFLWTIQKYLHAALHVITAWGFTHVNTFVWHKSGGFQPRGLQQYNCEFVLYARKGSPKFVDTKAFPLCFSAPRGKHSEKPDKFYDMVARCTGKKRLNMFARRKRVGFDSWRMK